MSDDPKHPSAPLLRRARLRPQGLDRQPFDAVLEDDFLYGDPAVDMPVTILLKRLQSDDTLLVLTGESGVGKSTQLRCLLLQGAKFGSFCAFKARPDTPFAAIEHTLRQHWNTVAPVEPDTPLGDWLCAMCREGHQPIVVIDDAHHLTPAALGELLRLRQTVRRRCPRGLKLLLAGAPGLAQRVEANADADSALEPVVEVVLRAFTWEQTEAYLRHRLLAAGAREPDRLSGDIAHAIHQQSGGLPHAINIAANRHLQGPHAPKPSPDLPAKAQLPAPGAPRSAAPLSSHAPPRSDPRPATENPLPPTAMTPPAQVPKSGHVAPGQPGTTNQGASGITRLLQDPGALRLVLVGVLMGLVILVLITLLAPPNDDAPEALRLPAPEAIPESTLGAPARPSAGTTTPSPNPAPLTPEPTPVEPTRIEPTRIEPTRIETPIEPGHPSDAPSVPGLRADSTTESTPAEPDPVEGQPTHAEPDLPTPPVRPPVPASAPVAGPRPVQEIAWIRRQDPGHWTLQIAAGGDRTALQAQARRLAQDPDFAPGAEVAWFQTRRNGRDWYTLILGPYPTAQTAQTAVAALPPALQRRQPWARPFAAIHQLLDPER